MVKEVFTSTQSLEPQWDNSNSVLLKNPIQRWKNLKYMWKKLEKQFVPLKYHFFVSKVWDINVFQICKSPRSCSKYKTDTNTWFHDN